MESLDSDAVSVATNQATGYNLSIADSDATVNMTNGGSGTITPGTGTAAAPLALSAGQWGYAVSGAPFDASYTVQNNKLSSTAKYAGITTSPVIIHSLNNATAGDGTTVYFAVKVNSSQQTGTYSDAVTYTAAVK